MCEDVAPLPVAPPTPGFDTMVVGHDSPFGAATGTCSEPRGTVCAIRPEGGGAFEVLAPIPPGGWP